MGDLVWVRDDVVLAVHKRQLAEHGGAEGIRDEGLLVSSLARPRNLVAYSDEKPELSAIAAAYAYGIIKNHPFVDGNKRTAYVCMRLFLKLNGLDIQAAQADKIRVMLDLAAGAIDRDGLADWLRSHVVSLVK